MIVSGSSSRIFVARSSIAPGCSRACSRPRPAIASSSEKSITSRSAGSDPRIASIFARCDASPTKIATTAESERMCSHSAAELVG